MIKLTFGTLFSGIGGADLALERIGMELKWQVEIDEFCLKILNKHWPSIPKFGDIKLLTGDELETVDVIFGSPPCQPFSYAGKRRGKEDDRNLWPEMYRIVKKLRPTWVICENVSGIIGVVLEEICTNLESEGYSVTPFIIPAIAIGTPHQRNRFWIVGRKGLAYSECDTQRTPLREGGDKGGAGSIPYDRDSLGYDIRDSGYKALDNSNCERELQPQGINGEQWRRTHNSSKDVGDSNLPRCQKQCRSCSMGQELRSIERGSCKDEWERTVESGLDRVPDGISYWLDRYKFPSWMGEEQHEWEPPRVAKGIPNRNNRLKALGNAIVPQVLEIIGINIIKTELNLGLEFLK